MTTLGKHNLRSEKRGARSAAKSLLWIGIATVLLACQTPEAGRPGSAISFTERFDSPIDDSWSWLHGDNASHRVQEGQLAIETGPSGVFLDDRQGKNLLLRPLPESEGVVCIQADLTSRPKNLYENAGLIVFDDEDNYTVLTKEAFPNQRDPALIVRVFSELRQRIEDDSEVSYSQAPRLRLRLRLTESSASGFFQETGSDKWIPVGSARLPPGRPLRVGVQTSYGAGSLAAPVRDSSRDWVGFDNFTISSPCYDSNLVAR